MTKTYIIVDSICAESKSIDGTDYAGSTSKPIAAWCATTSGYIDGEQLARY